MTRVEGQGYAFGGERASRIAENVAKTQREPKLAKSLFRTRAQIDADAREAQARMDERMNSIADLVAEGALPHHAGKQLGLTKGQTARAWNLIKAGLGPQAA
jgi:hypothetical protein